MTPLATIASASAAVGHLTPSGSRQAKNALSSTIWYIVSVSVDSVAVMPRTPAVTVPYSTAFISANSAPSWNVSVPGLVTIRTPRKPRSSAPQRTAPTFSLSTTADASVANSGAEKLIANALASGIRLNASTISVCAVPCDSARSRWAPGRRVRNTASPLRGRMMSAQIASEASVRTSISSPTG
jgi:hypothetical protein